MMFTKVFAEILGKYVADTAFKKFNNLEDALSHLFWWEENFELKREGDNIVSKGVCPVYRYYMKWCEDSCLAFIEKIAERYGYTVERRQKAPESTLCEFIFKKKG